MKLFLVLPVFMFSTAAACASSPNPKPILLGVDNAGSEWLYKYQNPDGTHRWDLRIEWLEQILPPQKPGEPALAGVTYDEIEHGQITRHQFAIYPEGGWGRGRTLLR